MSQFLDQMMVRPSISAGPRSCSLSLFAVLGSVFIVTLVLLSNLPALGGFLTELASTNSRCSEGCIPAIFSIWGAYPVAMMSQRSWMLR